MKYELSISYTIRLFLYTNGSQSYSWIILFVTCLKIKLQFKAITTVTDRGYFERSLYDEGN